MSLIESCKEKTNHDQYHPLSQCFQTINATFAIKASVPWFSKLTEPSISLRSKESCVCTLTVQDTQSRVWQMLSRLCFTWAIRYVHVIPFSERYWDCFSHIKNCNTDSTELFWSVEWDIDIASQQSNEVQSSWAVLKEIFYLFDRIIWLH